MSKKIMLFLIVFILGLVIFIDYKFVLCLFILILPISDINIFWLVGVLFFYIGRIIGNIRASLEIGIRIKRMQLDNPYIYFREIPNKYGVGVSAKILNYKLKKSHILAGILDLCAKGYIKFIQDGRKYNIVYNDMDVDSLLDNELYLLDCVLNKEKKCNLKVWEELCAHDAVSVGLAKRSYVNIYKSLFSFDVKFYKNLYFVSLLIAIVLVNILCGFLTFNIKVIGYIFATIIISGFVYAILVVFLVLINLIYEAKIISYASKKYSVLELTKRGKSEYHELCSLGKFLNDFGRFSEKHLEEIVIWEQYLSYAMLFGLGKKILKTGYNKLSINDRFVIDDINKINL